MVAKHVDHGGHGLFLRSASAGALALVGFAIFGLFQSDFAHRGGVHTPHEVVDAPIERLAFVVETGVVLLREGASGRTAGYRRYLLEGDLLGFPLGDSCLLVLLRFPAFFRAVAFSFGWSVLACWRLELLGDLFRKLEVPF